MTIDRGQNKQGDQGPDFTLAELVKGEVALCLHQGEILHVIKEHMTPSEAVAMLQDVLTGKISPDDLSKYQWREVNMHEAGFVGRECIELPPVKDWPQ